MALNFRMWRSTPLSSEEVELATLVAIHPDRIREVPDKIRPRVGVAADAIKKGASWTRPFVPGSRNADVKPLQVRTVAEAASRALGPSSPATPADIELALRRQGIDWVEPFAPGKPLVPYYGYGRRPRTYDYRVGRNITTETRPDRIPFQTLEQVFTGYDIAQTCARHILADLRSMPLQFSPVEGYNGKVEKEIAQARKFLAKPDGYHPWGVWLSPLVMDVLMYDAGTLWRDRDRAGRVTGVQWIDGTTIAPELDYFGFTPKPPAPAFQQFIQGIPWNWLTTDDIIYQPQWMVANSPYGVAPIETVLINANTDVRLQMFFLQFFCYDDQTEVLTREGWRGFDALDGSEEYATRSASGAFEWQHTIDGEVHRFPYDGDLVRFSNQCIDQLVTPNHRMLVRRLPGRTGAKPSNASHEWHIRRADFFVEHPTAEFQVPVTSEWQGADPGPEVVLTAEPNGKRARVREVRMPTSAWAELLGVFVAEGCLRRRTGTRAAQCNDVVIAQFPGGDLEEVRRILGDTGLTWAYSPKQGRFTCSSKALYEALEAVGHGAPNKRLPSEVMDWTPGLIKHLLHGLMVGDGHTTPSGQQVYTTTSSVLADQVQELWQKVGVYAGVHRYEPDPRTYAKLVQYKVRTRPEGAFRIPSPTQEHYEGTVSCVSVPNGIIMVRRNGKAMWCGNTAGAVPEMFIEAPADMTDPDALAEFEETFNARLEGNQAARHGLQWLPSGSKPIPYKQIEQIDPKIAEYVMRRTIAAFGLVPQDLGVVQDVNRSTADTQMDTQFRISSKPNTAHYESIINGILQDDLQLPVQAKFDDGREKEDRLMEAQAHQIYVSIGAESPDQVATDVLGLEVDPQHPTPRSIAVQGVGLVPLSYLMSVAGDIDPATAAPVAGSVTAQPVGIAPAIVKPQSFAPQEAPPDGTDPGTPPKLGPGPTGHGGPNGGEGRPPMPTTAQEPSSGGVVSNHPSEGSYGKPGYGVGEVEARGKRIKKEGITTSTGIAGVDLDEEEEDLKRWRANARKQVARGRAPREFLDSAISPDTYSRVWERLGLATTREEVDLAFKETTPNPKGRPGPWGHLEEELVAFYTPVVLASLAGGLTAQQVVERWLVERGQYSAMPKDSDGAEAMTWAYAELLGRPTPKLRETVGRIYRDSFVAGAKDGLTQLGERAKRTPLASAVNRVDWSAWKPGEPLSNEDLQDTGYSRMLGQLNTWVPAMDDTTKRQIAQALQDGVDQGLGSQAIADKIDLVLHDPKRSEMIARTEVNRAMSQASAEIYRQHGIAEWDLVTAWDPCPVCLAVKAGNPHPMTDTAQISPLHPRCRCSIAPALNHKTDEDDQPAAPGAQTISEAVSNVPLGFVGDVDQTSTRNAVGQSISQTIGGS